MIKTAFFLALGAVAILGFGGTAMAASHGGVNPCAASSNNMKSSHDKTKAMNPCAASSNSMKPKSDKAKAMNPCAAQ